MRLKGLLLVNLGTPNAPDRKSVGRFLAAFLADPRVVDLPRWLWLPLLRLVVVPLRSGRSARAYQKIWSEDGSPLLVLTQSLASKLQQSLGTESLVVAGMRYGEPAIEEALSRLRDQGVEDLTVLPLYPQYSRTTTASIEDALAAALAMLQWQPQVRMIHDYHVLPAWVEAVADSIRNFQARHGRPDKLLFSLHGIPRRYVAQGDPYRRQCEASVRAISQSLALDEDDWLLTYQSRVGRESWLQPYTAETLRALAGDGVRHLQVVCPGFAVDCLETLEEIAMQNKTIFLEAGGACFEYIPALNDSPAHISALKRLLETTSGA